MKFVIGNDHGGIDLVEAITQELKDLGHEVKWIGTFDKQSCDYPDIASETLKEITEKNADLAILICGTGVGMSISANKIKGIRACCVSEPYSAKMSREHNDCNCLCLGARVVGTELAKMIVHNFAQSSFLHDRHERRVQKINKLEEK